MRILLDQQPLDKTGGILYLYKEDDHYLITVENKIDTFYEELRNTPDRLQALLAFEHIYQSSADDTFKPVRVGASRVVSDWVRTGVNE